MILKEVSMSEVKSTAAKQRRELTTQDLKTINFVYKKCKDDSGVATFSNMSKMLKEKYEITPTTDFIGIKKLKEIFEQYLSNRYEIVNADIPTLNGVKELYKTAASKGGIEIVKKVNDSKKEFSEKAQKIEPQTASIKSKNQVEHKSGLSNTKLIQFAHYENIREPLKVLSHKCKKENWGNENENLFYYLNDYLELIENEDKKIKDENQKYVFYNKEQTKCLFNTRLLTNTSDDIFMCFDIQNGKKTFAGFFARGELWVRNVNLPKPFTFKQEDIQFDTKLEFEYNMQHIFERREKIPEEFRDNDKVINYFIKGEIENFRKILEREPYNLPSMIIPMYYPNECRVGFFFPIYWSNNSSEPENVVVCIRETSSDKPQPYYAFRTILNLKNDTTPYRYARIISKPNVEWLKPKGRL